LMPELDLSGRPTEPKRLADVLRRYGAPIQQWM
jgi:hypothetical protein